MATATNAAACAAPRFGLCSASGGGGVTAGKVVSPNADAEVEGGGGSGGNGGGGSSGGGDGSGDSDKELPENNKAYAYRTNASYGSNRVGRVTGETLRVPSDAFIDPEHGHDHAYSVAQKIQPEYMYRVLVPNFSANPDGFLAAVMHSGSEADATNMGTQPNATFGNHLSLGFKVTKDGKVYFNRLHEAVLIAEDLYAGGHIDFVFHATHMEARLSTQSTSWSANYVEHLKYQYRLDFSNIQVGVWVRQDLPPHLIIIKLPREF